MTTTTPEALALATAARLAHANREDWACVPFVGAPTWGRRSDGRWGCNACCDGDRCDNARHVDREKCTICDGTGALPHRMMVIPPLPPTLDEAQAEWAAAGGDPERGPALSWRSEDGRGEWSVKVSGGGDTGLRAMIVVRIRVGSAAYVRFGNETWVPEGRAPLADWRECVRLAEAADGGAR